MQYENWFEFNLRWGQDWKIFLESGENIWSCPKKVFKWIVKLFSGQCSFRLCWEQTHINTNGRWSLLFFKVGSINLYWTLNQSSTRRQILEDERKRRRTYLKAELFRCDSISRSRHVTQSHFVSKTCIHRKTCYYFRLWILVKWLQLFQIIVLKQNGCNYFRLY